MSAQPELLSPEKRAQILRGAEVAFGAHGYEGASMADVARAAGVSKGTLYNHFENKADLFAVFVNQQCDRDLAHIFDGLEPDGDPAMVLHSLGTRMLKMCLSDSFLTVYRVVVSEAHKFPELARVFWNAGAARGIARMSAWLADQTARGKLAVADPDFASEQFFGLCQTRLWAKHRLMMLEHPPRPEQIDAVVNASVTMFLNTYRA